MAAVCTAPRLIDSRHQPDNHRAERTDWFRVMLVYISYRMDWSKPRFRSYRVSRNQLPE